eukprot:SAG31_NODE_751_length_12354_cov_14.018605_6_plen_503_part_00
MILNLITLLCAAALNPGGTPALATPAATNAAVAPFFPPVTPATTNVAVTTSSTQVVYTNLTVKVPVVKTSPPSLSPRPLWKPQSIGPIHLDFLTGSLYDGSDAWLDGDTVNKAPRETVLKKALRFRSVLTVLNYVIIPFHNKAIIPAWNWIYIPMLRLLNSILLGVVLHINWCFRFAACAVFCVIVTKIVTKKMLRSGNGLDDLKGLRGGMQSSDAGSGWIWAGSVPQNMVNFDPDNDVMTAPIGFSSKFKNWPNVLRLLREIDYSYTETDNFSTVNGFRFDPINLSKVYIFFSSDTPTFEGLQINPAMAQLFARVYSEVLHELLRGLRGGNDGSAPPPTPSPSPRPPLRPSLNVINIDARRGVVTAPVGFSAQFDNWDRILSRLENEWRYQYVESDEIAGTTGVLINIRTTDNFHVSDLFMPHDVARQLVNLFSTLVMDMLRGLRGGMMSSQNQGGYQDPVTYLDYACPHKPVLNLVLNFVSLATLIFSGWPPQWPPYDKF